MSSTPTTTMKAWAHTRTGPASEVLSLITVSRPKITLPSQILIKTSHCALNPGPRILMQLVPFIFRASPAIPEMDFSGTIVETGSGVPTDRDLVAGIEVFGSIPVGQHIKQTSGALAEYVVVDHSAVTRKPKTVSLQEAAGLGIAGATALKLITDAKLKEGDKVLVNGASGGIGHLVMQMCQNSVGKSGLVVATCSKSNVEWLQAIGAREQKGALATVSLEPSTLKVIDYNEHAPVSSYLAETYGKDPFDVVIDAVGIQDIFYRSPDFLKKGGPYVTVGPKASKYTYACMLGTLWSMAKNFLWPQKLGGTPRPYVQVTAASSLEALSELAKMVEMGHIKVHVGSLIKMEEGLKAYEQSLAGHAQGKTVVQVEEET